MNKTPFDILPLIQGVEAVKASSLTKEQKDAILSEMAKSIPAPVFCKGCPATLTVLESILGVKRDSPKKPPQEIPEEAPDTPKQSAPSGEEELLRKTNGNRGRSRTSTTVVNKASKKRG